MLLRRETLQGVKDGNVDLAFRRWIRPTVRTGGSLRTSHGVVQIERVEKIDPGDITPEDARRAGLDLDELLTLLTARDEGEVYRIEFGSIGPDPRIALGQDADLSEDDLTELAERLERLDRASKRGPWTQELLELLEANPHVRAQDLADRLGVEKTQFKNDVRKLKSLGLTISHSPGYELSPRGRAFLRLTGDRRG